MKNHVEKNAQICRKSHFIYHGFTVQPGMIFGRTTSDQAFVSNGKARTVQSQNSFQVYFHTIGIDGKDIWIKKMVTETSNKQVYNLIAKQAEKRTEKGISLEYRTADQLEEERWNNGDNAHFFPQSVPFKASRCTVPDKRANGEARYRSIVDQNTLTQRVNRTYYGTSNGHTIII